MLRKVYPMSVEDIHYILDYFLSASPEFLRGMGADSEKLPSRSQWHAIIDDDLQLPFHKKTLFYVIWMLDDIPVGHSNINKINFGEAANMHLHLWKRSERKQGNGSYFIKESLNYYFDYFQLKKIYCEPYSDNPAPNKTLLKTGFRFIKEYKTTPGSINFYQSVNRWELSQENFKKLYT